MIPQLRVVVERSVVIPLWHDVLIAVGITIVVAIHTNTRACHHIVLCIEGTRGEHGVGVIVVFGGVGVVNVAAGSFSAISAGDGIADILHAAFRLARSSEQLGTVGKEEAAELGAVAIALIHQHSLHRVAVAAQGCGNPDYRIFLREENLACRLIIHLHHKVATARLCLHGNLRPGEISLDGSAGIHHERRFGIGEVHSPSIYYAFVGRTDWRGCLSHNSGSKQYRRRN